MSLRTDITTLLLGASCFLNAQHGAYGYKKEITGITAQWHRIDLPEDVLERTSVDLYDLRIFGVTPKKDTVEVPYFLRVASEEEVTRDLNFRTLNVSGNARGYYYTFEVPTADAVNRIKLDLKQNNFDWNVDLEGSQDQKQWFSLLENYRILSIRNESANFRFTEIKFPDSKFRFFRVHIRGTEKPVLIGAKVSHTETKSSRLRSFSVLETKTTQNKKTRETELNITLKRNVPVSQVKLFVADTGDYYRTFTLKFLADSLRAGNTWLPVYRDLYSGTVSSVKGSLIRFPETKVRMLKILIQNHDNNHLTIDSVQVMGYVHEMVAQFHDNRAEEVLPPKYFLLYGNSKPVRPIYDLTHFRDKVPARLEEASLGIQEKNDAAAPIDSTLVNKTWLWLIIGLIVIVLGWFSLRMIRRA